MQPPALLEPNPRSPTSDGKGEKEGSRGAARGPGTRLGCLPDPWAVKLPVLTQLSAKRKHFLKITPKLSIPLGHGWALTDGALSPGVH